MFINNDYLTPTPIPQPCYDQPTRVGVGFIGVDAFVLDDNRSWVYDSDYYAGIAPTDAIICMET